MEAKISFYVEENTPRELLRDVLFRVLFPGESIDNSVNASRALVAWHGVDVFCDCRACPPTWTTARVLSRARAYKIFHTVSFFTQRLIFFVWKE